MFKYFHHMAVFATLVQNGSFTKTAERLNMTKSRVSQQISELEEHLGLRLLNRTTRKISLTYAGEIYLRPCQEMIDVASKADEVIQLLRESPKGKLRIVAPPGFMYSALPAPHHEFLKTHPEVELELFTADSFSGTVSDTFDVAYRIGKPSDDSFIGRFLGSFNRFIVAIPEYLREHQINTPEELLDCDLITHKTWRSVTLSGGNSHYELAMKMRHTSDNLTYILQQALQGSGLAILPEYIVTPYLQSGQLKIILPEWTVQKIDLWMIYPSNKNNTLMLRNYIEFVLNNNTIKALTKSKTTDQ